MVERNIWTRFSETQTRQAYLIYHSLQVSSNFHVELSPGDAGLNDRNVVQQVIREMASHKVIGTTAPYKIVVLQEVDRLTRQAQAALRRTMEKYASSCRLILVCRIQSAVDVLVFVWQHPVMMRYAMIVFVSDDCECCHGQENSFTYSLSLLQICKSPQDCRFQGKYCTFR